LNNEDAIAKIREEILQGRAIHEINEKMLDTICASSVEGGGGVGCDNMTSIIIKFKKEEKKHSEIEDPYEVTNEK